MTKREARRVRRELTPEEKRRWEKAKQESAAEREQIVKLARAVIGAARRLPDVG